MISPAIINLLVTGSRDDKLATVSKYLEEVVDKPDTVRNEGVGSLIWNMAKVPDEKKRTELYHIFLDSASKFDEPQRNKIIKSQAAVFHYIPEPLAALELDSELKSNPELLKPLQEIIETSLKELPKDKLDAVIERLSPEALKLMKDRYNIQTTYNLPKLHEDDRYRAINEETYYTNLSENQEKYPGEYIGIVNGKIVAHNKDLNTLTEELEKIEPEPSKRFIAKTDIDYRHTSEIF
jgi:hypothetical protein